MDQKWLTAIVVTFAFLLPFSTESYAQYVDRDDEMRFEEEFDTDDFMITARTRAVAVPGFMLDIFFDRHKNHWSDGKENLSFGGEFTWRRNDEYEITFAIDWADLGMSPGFWLESGERPLETDWATVDLQLLSFVVSTYWFWDVEEWFSPFVGGGIGPAIVLGEYVKFNPSQGSQCQADLAGGGSFPGACFTDEGEPRGAAFDDGQEEDLIPVIPIINLTGGLRFNIGDHLVAKLEAGLYTYVYAGVSLGAQW